MEKLSHLIVDCVDNKRWNLMKLGRNGTAISHLLFADTLLLICEANLEHICMVLEILEKFGDISRETVNVQKTSTFFSKYMSRSVQNEVCMYSGFKKMDDLGRYLGAYMTGGRDHKKNFQYILYKLQGQLSSWKKQVLSLARRLTLVQSITNQMSVFYMQHSHLPVSVRNQMERIQRDFFWKNEAEKRKIPPVSWEVLCKGKRMVVFGRDILKPRMMLCAWNIISKPDSLCSSVLVGKYGRKKDLMKECACLRSDSIVWKNLCRLWPKVLENVYWDVRNGERISFWYDRWMYDREVLADNSIRRVIGEKRKWTVKEMVDADGAWDMERISGYVTEEGKSLIMAVPPPNESCGEDVIRWGVKLQNKYSCADMYHMLRNKEDRVKRVWNQVWKWKGPRRVQIFLWIFTHDRLLTGERKCRLLGGGSSCYKCWGVEETIMYVLRDCQSAWNLWSALSSVGLATEFVNLQGKEWFGWNLAKSNNDWNLKFGIACWMLWNWRNKGMFEDSFVMPADCSLFVQRYVQEMKQARREFGRIEGLKQEVCIGWVTPKPGWAKLNVDGASRGRERIAGCRGVIRSHRGEWIAGFSKKLRCCSAIIAELWGVLTGLQLAEECKLDCLIVECDSRTVVHMLRKLQNEGPDKTDPRLLSDIHRAMVKFSCLVCEHVYREGNKCTDALANLCYVQEENYACFDYPPAIVKDLIQRDVMGVSYPRHFLIQ